MPPRLSRIQVENDRCLRKVTVDLGELTVFVGPIGAGKSLLLAALDPQRSAEDPGHGYQRLRLEPNALAEPVSIEASGRMRESGFGLANLFATLTRAHQADVDDPEWRRAYAEHDEQLGSVWLTGSLGGVPGS